MRSLKDTGIVKCYCHYEVKLGNFSGFSCKLSGEKSWHWNTKHNLNNNLKAERKMKNYFLILWTNYSISICFSDVQQLLKTCTAHLNCRDFSNLLAKSTHISKMGPGLSVIYIADILCEPLVSRLVLYQLHRISLFG